MMCLLFLKCNMMAIIANRREQHIQPNPNIHPVCCTDRRLGKLLTFDENVTKGRPGKLLTFDENVTKGRPGKLLTFDENVTKGLLTIFGILIQAKCNMAAIFANAHVKCLATEIHPVCCTDREVQNPLMAYLTILDDCFQKVLMCDIKQDDHNFSKTRNSESTSNINTDFIYVYIDNITKFNRINSCNNKKSTMPQPVIKNKESALAPNLPSMQQVPPEIQSPLMLSKQPLQEQQTYVTVLKTENEHLEKDDIMVEANPTPNLHPVNYTVFMLKAPGVSTLTSSEAHHHGSHDARYSMESVRYGSFEHFLMTSAWPHRLAAAGFYHSGPDNQVTCYSCGMTYSNWRRTDDPMDVHKRLSPTCRFIRGLEENHPIEYQEEDRARLERISGVSRNLLSNPSARDTAQQSTSPAETRSDAVLVTSTISTESSTLVTSFGLAHTTGRCLTSGSITDNDLFDCPSTPDGNLIIGHGSSVTGAASANPTLPSESPRNTPRSSRTLQHPRHAQYAELIKRVMTFAGHWPHHNHQTPQQLGEAGFYFSGRSQDSTMCYYCGGGLRNWIEGDNPFVEHARWFPFCEFIRATKGDTFVDMVQEMYENEEEIDYDQVMAIINDTRPLADRLGIKTHEGDSSPSYLKDDRQSIVSTPCSVNNTSDPTMTASISSTPSSPDREEQLLCKVCLENQICIVFLPCGHLCCCSVCASKVRKCPMCRARIQGTVKAYI